MARLFKNKKLRPKIPNFAKTIRRSRKKAGAPPGTLIYTGEQKLEKVRIIVTDYSQDHLKHAEVDDVEELRPYLKTDSKTWIQVQGIHDVERIRAIGDFFDLHPLVLEDILNPGQRPKKEDYDNYIFFILRLLNFPNEHNELVSEQFSIICGDNFVLSFQESDFPHFDMINERLKNDNSRIRKMGSDYLNYALMDLVVDYYFRVHEHMDERLERIEDELMTDPEPETHQQLHDMRREVINLRKVVWPLRDVLNSVIRDEHPLIHTETKMFFRDVYDHVVLLIDTNENNRDVIMGMFDTYMSAVSNRMNEVMKVLTIIATIFIPLTFIVGVYGMNFNPEASPWSMPELNTYYGYPITWAIMVLITFGMVMYFKRKRWL